MKVPLSNLVGNHYYTGKHLPKPDKWDICKLPPTSMTSERKELIYQDLLIVLFFFLK